MAIFASPALVVNVKGYFNMPPPKEAFTADAKSNSPLSAAVAAGLPVMCADEILTAAELGQGGFCSVKAVRAIKLEPVNKALVLTEDEISSRRKFIKRFGNYDKAHYSYRHVPGQPVPVGDPAQQKPPKLALKRLKTSLNKKRYAIGLSDLTSEVSLLVSLRHPNIITVYGVGYDNSDKKSENNQSGSQAQGKSITFVLLDQLRCTLKNKLYMWRERRGMGMLISRAQLNELWLERMVILMRIASAIEFLHSKGVAHRDLNPDNVGFDSDDVPKLFDFGLARVVGSKRLPPGELPDPSEASGGDDAKYEMTTNTGTIRYMAPEIALSEKYGKKVDVYSFAILMHEVLSLYKPFSNVPSTTFTSTVAIKGLRPNIDACWPEGIKHMMKRMWDGESSNRPTSKEVVAVFESLLRGSDGQLYPIPVLRRLLAR